MKKQLCLVLILAMILSLLSGCFPSSPIRIPTIADPAETSAPPYENRSLTIKEAELTYNLTAADFDKFEQMLADFEIAAISVTDPDEIDRLYTELEDQYDYLDGQASVATVLYYSDLTDTAAQEKYLYATKSLTEADDTYLMTMRKLYNGDYAAKDIIFEDWSEADIQNLLAYTEEVMQLKKRNTEINAAYQDLQEDPELNEKMIPLYIELVENNNRLAQIYGYENYYEYAYQVGYERDYGLDQVTAMQTYTAQYLLPAMEGALTKFTTAYQALTEEEINEMVLYLYSPFTELDHSYLEDYLDILPTDARNTMLNMFDGDIMLLDDKESAMEGAFTTTIGSDRALCFFGPGYADTLTAVHEVGHYYGCRYTYMNDIPLDLAEVHSQGNEWLFTAFMEGQISENLYTALVNYKMYNDLAVVVIGQVVDAFEYKVYTAENVSQFTSQDFDRLMEEACEIYGGITYFSENLTDIQNYWRMVVIEQPVYYVSYAVSALASMDLYAVAQQDFDKAIECYVNLSEELDPEKGFLQNLTDAGLKTPFDEETYRALYRQFAVE